MDAVREATEEDSWALEDEQVLRMCWEPALGPFLISFANRAGIAV